MSEERAFHRAPASVAITRSGPLSGRVRVPGSKSQTARAFVLAALGAGESRITGALVADDSRHMVHGLRALGIAVEALDDAGEQWRVTGSGGALPDVGPVTIDSGFAGTVMRFLTAAATLAPHQTTLTGRPTLLTRPVGELLKVLEQLGAEVSANGDFPPVVVHPGLPRGGAATVDSSRSSQFASALLLAAPFFPDGLVLELSGLGAPGYFDMTLEMLRRRGVAVERDGMRLVIPPGGHGYAAIDEDVAGDASAASHVFTLAAATGGTITVEKLAGATMQPDMRILQVLADFGCTVTHDPDGSITVSGPQRLRPVEADLSQTPDQLPNIAVLAALAEGRSVIRGVGITRFHETDRIASLETELAKVGVTVTSTRDDVFVEGGTARPGASLYSHHDHRLAMAFASLGAAVDDIVVDNADAVEKTYPAFWSDVEALGGKLSAN
ncbi:3-phosphoshikimate 1-carboxyvinyltransferase [Catellatospora sp. KI3]|uniref:3-phosphoshikimate 1-carboxyvinyltransferase n=1 Tax=Catellatospora sp. KI3 TaxID=3041620 RepID=UPI0024830EC6|nr:3-phosphoshikimate 1-carboxyvinyltransferase [Catellatospora sp. KI3]MDI1461164.1 3-phosphoshikimate 1-carboxyvinyltransferase [Catellatospora sp. KI3]